jgi:PadR family transcriptional regulator AphA
MDVRTMCLGLLVKQESTGYEIKKAITNGHASIFYDASLGAIYPALNRLTEDGLVTCEEQSQDKRPDKKVYRITTAGMTTFEMALLQPPTADKFRSDFLAAMFFCGQMPDSRLEEILDERETFHTARLAALEELEIESQSVGETFLTRYAMMYHASNVKFLKENRYLLDTSSTEESNVEVAQ